MNAFIDTAVITVRSGKGGDGCSHLRREKDRPKGGPDGGDGGRGGDVTVVADPHLDTLIEFSFRAHFFAQDGERGQQKSCHGGDGQGVEIRLPVGSSVYDAETGDMLVDLVLAGQRAVVAPGGAGGFGNEHFKGPLKQTPTESTPGEPAVERRLRIELKLIADIGLVGLPNAGKSTLLRAISRANAKVGAYPFTTLSPQLGIAELDPERRLVFADLPGLIEGAAQGAGLGHDFLKHVERTRAIVHLVDLAPLDGSDPAENWRMIRRELLEFSAELAEKPELVVLNKVDLVPAEELEVRIERFAGAIGMARGERPVAISGATGQGVRPMLEAAWSLAERGPVPAWRG
ncbi:MAG: GTPase ObgE [Phycisphaerales bacterium]